MLLQSTLYRLSSMSDRNADLPPEDWMDAMLSQEVEAAQPMDSDGDSYQSLDTEDEVSSRDHASTPKVL